MKVSKEVPLISYLFEAQESDSLIAWSEEDSKFSEMEELFPEIVKIGWEHVPAFPSHTAILKVTMTSDGNLTEIVKYIKQNIIKGE